MNLKYITIYTLTHSLKYPAQNKSKSSAYPVKNDTKQMLRTIKWNQSDDCSKVTTTWSLMFYHGDQFKMPKVKFPNLYESNNTFPKRYERSEWSRRLAATDEVLHDSVFINNEINKKTYSRACALPSWLWISAREDRLKIRSLNKQTDTDQIQQCYDKAFIHTR